MHSSCIACFIYIFYTFDEVYLYIYASDEVSCYLFCDFFLNLTFKSLLLYKSFKKLDIYNTSSSFYKILPDFWNLPVSTFLIHLKSKCFFYFSKIQNCSGSDYITDISCNIMQCWRHTSNQPCAKLGLVSNVQSDFSPHSMCL